MSEMWGNQQGRGTQPRLLSNNPIGYDLLGKIIVGSISLKSTHGKSNKMNTKRGTVVRFKHSLLIILTKSQQM